MGDGPELENGTAAPAVKPGAETTEYKTTQGAAAMANVATVLGMLATFGSTIAESMGANTKLGIVVGAVVAVAGIISRTLVQLGYVKSRTDIKTGGGL